MAKPVVAGSLRWASRQDAELECLNILRNSGYLPGDTVTDAHDIEVLTSLATIHPHAADKIGPGIDRFEVAKMAPIPGQDVSDDSIGFVICQVDGNRVDFSYREAIYPSDQKRKVTTALKAGVEDLRLAYRDSRFATPPVASDVSGTVFARRRDAGVIYESPTFAQLAYRFAESEGGWSAIAVESGGRTAFIGETLADADVLDRWRAFYRSYARPGLATASEGARRPRSDETAWTP